MTLFSANILVCADIRGVHWRQGVKRQWSNRNMDLHGFRHYVFSKLRNETNTNVIIYYY